MAALICAAAPSAFAQERISFERITIDDGLSQSYVFAIHQDRSGFLWFGTEDGLNRYDGYEFSVFSYSPRDPASISESNIWTIYETRDGMLWIGTINGGLNCLERGKHGFTALRHNPDDPESLSNDIVLSLCEDREGYLWVGTNGGLNRLDRTSGKFRRFLHDPADPDSITSNLVYTIHQDRAGLIWIGTQNGGLNCYDPVTDTFLRPGNGRRLPWNFVRHIIEDSDGSLWLAIIDGGLVHYDPVGDRIIESFRTDPRDSASLPHDEVMALLLDRDGTLWVGTRAGLALFDREHRNFHRFLHADNDPSSLVSSVIYSLGQDRSGIIWIGTFAGISKLDPRRARFHHVQSSAEPGHLKGENVFAIYEDRDSTLWVGTDRGGLNRRAAGSRTWTQFVHDPHDARSISSNFVRSILEDSYGEFWVGTGGDGLNRRLKSGGFRHYFERNGSGALADNYVRLIFEDSRRRLWIGTNAGLQLYNRERDDFTTYRNVPGREDSISQDFIYSIAEDGEGRLWVGTRFGLNRFDEATGSFVRYSHDPNDPFSLNEDEIYSILVTRSGTTWIGTSNGLNRYDATQDRFASPLETGGITLRSIYAMREDSFGQLWLATNRGLVRYHPESGAVRVFYRQDGLQSDEFNLGASWISEDGTLWFGGISGFNSFLPQEIVDDPTISDVVLTNVSVFGRPFVPAQVSPTLREVVLDYRDTYVSFEFTVMDFRAPSKNRYSWRMEGVDPEWTESNQRQASYANLAPGTYTLKIRGANSEGLWNEDGISLRIVVTPPFWDTWWFRTIFICIVIAGTGLFLYNRSLMHERRRMALQKEVEARTNELKVALEELDSFAYTVSHDLRAPLRLVSQYAGLLKENLQDRLGDEERYFVGKIDNALVRMDSLIQDILWFSRASRMELQNQPFDLSIVVREVILMRTQASPERRVETVVKPDVQVVGDERLLRVALENLIDNAWKFTAHVAPARVEFGTTILNGDTVYFMRDNGAGFDPALTESLFTPFQRLHSDTEFEGTGIGLATVRRIIERHHGRIWAEGEPGHGATFYFTLGSPQSQKQAED